MGNDARNPHCLNKDLHCKKCVMKKDSHKELQKQTMANEARKTHCSDKELQCKKWVIKEDSHKELQCKQWVMMQGRVIGHRRSYNANKW
ncbi:hypothetical protein KSS87_023654 [Heliosperma pusillum]|nr:hypothetical protein KSS87_023654 [Heliosperma pusillum]